MAQGVFFVLLLSISEYYAFAWAYLVAAVACISLITWYLYFVVQGYKAALLFGLLLSTLYGMMYLLLQSSGKTFYLVLFFPSFLSPASCLLLVMSIGINQNNKPYKSSWAKFLFRPSTKSY
jgi:inner membrane protein involved in colicin E2 resistance